MILLVNGCSHTSGAEIQGPRTPHCYDKAWPKHLAELLGWDIVNLSRSGGSSERVLRTTVNWLGANYTKNLSGKVFFIALWPGITRKEIRCKEFVFRESKTNPNIYKADDNWMTLVLGNVKSYADAVKKGWFPKELFDYYRYWINIVTDEELHERQYMNILSLQGVIKSLDIPYLFQNSTTALNASHEYERLIPLIDKSKFFGWKDYNKSYDTLLKYQGFSYPKWSKGHFDEDAHIWYAKYMYQMIKSKHPNLTSAMQ